ncbi:MAG: hypothetical protein ACXADY_25135 [Candidatus Hodarchaeales archaeon]|jgi:hypothetical protein
MMIATKVSHDLEMIFNFINSVSYIPAPPRLNIFEIILISSVMTAVLALEILFLYVLFKKLVKSQVTLESKKTTPLGVKISSILVMVLGGPELISGGYFIIIDYYSLFITAQGYLGLILFIFVFGAFFTGIGVISLIIGVGLYRLNQTAWKGSIFFLLILTISKFIPGFNIYYYRFILFPFYGGWWPSSVVTLLNVLPFLSGFCYLGLLIYTLRNQPPQFKENESEIQIEYKKLIEIKRNRDE